MAAVESDRINTVAERFQVGGYDVSVTQLVVLVIVLLLVAAVLWKVARVIALRDGQNFDSPARLFNDLCRLHGLDFPSRKLLWRLAKIRQLDHPAQLFLEPTWFDTAHVPASLQPFRPQLAELKQQLFAGRTAPPKS